MKQVIHLARQYAIFPLGFKEAIGTFSNADDDYGDDDCNDDSNKNNKDLAGPMGFDPMTTSSGGLYSFFFLSF